jgi:hypothetical protein
MAEASAVARSSLAGSRHAALVSFRQSGLRERGEAVSVQNPVQSSEQNEHL